ncbi:unnamed protein product [Gadus morhua 'NCC']
MLNIDTESEVQLAGRDITVTRSGPQPGLAVMRHRGGEDCLLNSCGLIMNPNDGRTARRHGEQQTGRATAAAAAAAAAAALNG